MKLPSRDFAFPNGLVVPVRTVKLTSWQYHVIKHPLGINRDARVQGDDPEGWGELRPPVIEPGWRAQVLGEIASIDARGARCELPEAHGRKLRKGEASTYPCWTCPETVARRCEAATHGDRPVAQRYAAAVEGLLAALLDGVKVGRNAYLHAVSKLARTPEALLDLCVLGVGRMNNNESRSVAQFKRGDGVLAEFYVYRGNEAAEWRTAYRQRCSGVAALRFMLTLPAAIPGELSETYLVARQWWESHGT